MSQLRTPSSQLLDIIHLKIPIRLSNAEQTVPSIHSVVLMQSTPFRIDSSIRCEADMYVSGPDTNLVASGYRYIASIQQHL